MFDIKTKCRIIIPPSDHLRRIRTSQTGRSMVDITGDADIFIYLHKYFVFLLKAGGHRIIECVLEGPPRVMAEPQHSLPQHQQLEGSTHHHHLKEGNLETPLTTLDFQVVTGSTHPHTHSMRTWCVCGIRCPLTQTRTTCIHRHIPTCIHADIPPHSPHASTQTHTPSLTTCIHTDIPPHSPHASTDILPHSPHASTQTYPSLTTCIHTRHTLTHRHTT